MSRWIFFQFREVSDSWYICKLPYNSSTNKNDFSIVSSTMGNRARARARMAGNYILISRDKRAREVAERVITLEKWIRRWPSLARLVAKYPREKRRAHGGKCASAPFHKSRASQLRATMKSSLKSVFRSNTACGPERMAGRCIRPRRNFNKSPLCVSGSAVYSVFADEHFHARPIQYQAFVILIILRTDRGPVIVNVFSAIATSISASMVQPGKLVNNSHGEWNYVTFRAKLRLPRETRQIERTLLERIGQREVFDNDAVVCS